jgi:hypothetical protein
MPTMPDPNPSGLCLCGCGRETTIANRNRYGSGMVKGCHTRYIPGHQPRLNPPGHSLDIPEPNPSGVCLCGCGQLAPLADSTSTKNGYIKGKPVRYILGHHLRKFDTPPPPNPSGRCMCGCGEPAPIAANTNHTTGAVKGEPQRYIFGHNKRFSAQMFSVDPTTGCWNWNWSLSNRGRPQLSVGGRMRGAHRVLYERHIGSIPKGHHLHHRCLNPICINPAHMEPLRPVDHYARHKELRSAQ